MDNIDNTFGTTEETIKQNHKLFPNTYNASPRLFTRICRLEFKSRLLRVEAKEELTKYLEACLAIDTSLPVGSIRFPDQFCLGTDFMYVTCEESLMALCELVCPSTLPGDEADITGALVKACNGGYAEIWMTTSSRPYSENTMYTRVY